MFRRTARTATSRLVALVAILLGVLPLLHLTGLDIPVLIAHQGLIYVAGSAVLGLLAVWLGCLWGWLGVGLAIFNLGLDAVLSILYSARHL